MLLFLILLLKMLLVGVVLAIARREFSWKGFITAFLVMAIAYWGLALPLGYYLGNSDPMSELHGALGFWWAMIAGIAVASTLSCARLWMHLHRPLPISESSRDSADLVST